MKTKRRNDARGKCRKPYQKQLDEGAAPEDILLAARWYVDKFRKDPEGFKYIKLASTWLNDEQWKDDLTEYKDHLSNLVARSGNVVPMARTNYVPFFLKSLKQSESA
jgi:hypothetical protein